MPAQDQAPAFDAVAAGYDDDFTRTATGRLQRALVHAQLERRLARDTGQDVLELGCGTGEDALFLARHGRRVLATDVAPAMLAVARAKLQAAGLETLVRFETLDARHLATWPAPGAFDLLFSNFGALNCLAPDELRDVGRAAAGRVRPGGQALLVVMPRMCLWESCYFASRLRLPSAVRRFGGGPVRASLGPSSTPTWYHTPAAVRRAFGPRFRQVGLVPVGLCLPPSYLDRLFVARPRALAFLARLEERLRSSLLAGFADHYCLVLERRTEPEAS